MKGALLWLETVLALHLAWGLVFLLPLRWLGGTRPPGVELAPVTPPVQARARGVCIRLERIASRLPWHSTCLVQAVAGMLLLRRRGIGGAVIRFGVRKNGPVLAAHAWLLLGDSILLGGDEAEGYIPLADLSRHLPP